MAGPGREWYFGISGTFDVENYGDLLFPLIAEAELRARLGDVRVVPYSYAAREPPLWPYEVRPLGELPAAVAGLDGLIVGGGHLIRFDRDVAPGYLPPAGIHHPTGFWLSPALVALGRGRPVAWNAPGVHGGIPAWAEPLLRAALFASAYVSVRDEPSRQTLAPLAPPGAIAVVPDTAFGVGRLVDPRRPSPALRRLREGAGLTGRYAVVQASAGTAPFLPQVRAEASRIPGCRLVSLPIGPVLGDDDSRLDDGGPPLVRLPRWPPPLSIAELVGQAEAVFGDSLHLSITALALGVAVWRPPGSGVGKHAVLSEFEGVATLGGDSGARRRPRPPDRLPGDLPSPSVRAALERLDRHWDRLADSLGTGEGRPASPALGPLWQSLPSVLEEWSEKHRAAVAGAAVAAAELERQIALLRKDVARVEGSRSWRLTAPLRALGRALGRARSLRGSR